MAQRVAGTVWKLVSKEFLNDQRLKSEHNRVSFDLSNLPVEQTLRDALRSALTELNTGTFDDNTANVGYASLQNEDILTKLKTSDGFNGKMPDFRETIFSIPPTVNIDD